MLKDLENIVIMMLCCALIWQKENYLGWIILSDIEDVELADVYCLSIFIEIKNRTLNKTPIHVEIQLKPFLSII